MYTLTVGIEHLRTGVEFDAKGNLTFHYETPTMFVVASLQPFNIYWPVKRSRLHASWTPGYDIPTYSYDDIKVPRVTLEEVR